VPLRGREEQARGLEHDGGAADVVTRRLHIAEEIVRDHRIGPAGGNLCEAVLHAVHGDERDVAQAEPLDNVAQGGRLNGPRQNHDSLALQIVNRADSRVPVAVELGPAVESRRTAERHPLRAGCAVGDIGHQVDVAFLQHPQASPPVTRHRLNGPVRPVGDGAGEGAEYARCLAVGEEDLRGVLVDAQRHGPGPGMRDSAEYQEKEKNQPHGASRRNLGRPDHRRSRRIGHHWHGVSSAFWQEFLVYRPL